MRLPRLTIGQQHYTVKGILFDKDGTLLDFVALWGTWCQFAYAHFAERFDGPIAPLDQLWGLKSDGAGQVVDYDCNGPVAMGSIGDLLSTLAWQGYQQGQPWGESIRLARACKEAADAEIQRIRPARPLPGVVDFVHQCYGLGLLLGVVTADETEDSKRHLEWMGIRPLFASVIGDDAVERGKPFPDMVYKACGELDLAPRDVAVIGDTNGDMQMGNAAGAAVTIGLAPSEHEVSLLGDAKVIVSAYDQIILEK
ncbi:HAD family hydrolase [Paenibacillus curdlanolyticus]|uniref:HAD family hydrolase n=1 Tax=Paenibacillus curdlanolyticus TaxID=59840 RepID=UPI0038990AD0